MRLLLYRTSFEEFCRVFSTSLSVFRAQQNVASQGCPRPRGTECHQHTVKTAIIDRNVARTRPIAEVEYYPSFRGFAVFAVRRLVLLRTEHTIASPPVKRNPQPLEAHPFERRFLGVADS